MQRIQKTNAPETVRHWLDAMIDTDTLEQTCEPFQPTRGAPPTLALPDLIRLCVYHEIVPTGSRATHAADVTDVGISDSAISQRLQGLDPRLFQAVLDHTLQPLADPRRHPQAFYKRWRLVGIDGSQFSVPNGPGVAAAWPKARSRRGRAAFSKLGICSLCELGLHNPLAGVIGEQGESEMVLAGSVFERLPPEALLLGDRYYGTGRCISDLIPLCQERNSQFLFRVRANLKRRVVEALPDGSALVAVDLTDDRVLRLREIEGKVRGRSGQVVRVRLWTSLLDARRHPANRLLKLYRERWEQEIATEELKQTLHGGALLRSQKPRTAWHEVAALLVAQSLVARMRVQVAEQAGAAVLRVSFEKTLESARVLCVVLVEAADLLSPTQMRKLSQRLMDRVARQLSGRRRARSCPRAVRQPIGPWPRKQKQRDSYGDFKYEVSKIK
jgi:hypothetical protein